jgi:hypothetical protein
MNPDQNTTYVRQSPPLAQQTPPGTARVRATKPGFAGGYRRATGDVFDCPMRELCLVHDDPQFGWMEGVDGPPPARSAHVVALEQARAAGKAGPPLHELHPPKLVSPRPDLAGAIVPTGE